MSLKTNGNVARHTSWGARLYSSMPPVTTFERRRSSLAPALSLGGRRIDGSTRANSFEVTVAL